MAIHEKQGRSGFTLVEIVLSIALLGILSMIGSEIIMPIVNSWTTVKTATTSKSEVSHSLDKIVSDIMQLNDQNGYISATGISNGQSHSIQIIDPNVSTITYQLSGNNLMRNSDVLLRRVQGLDFTYWNVNNGQIYPPFSTITDIWLIKILITMQAEGNNSPTIMERIIHPKNVWR